MRRGQVLSAPNTVKTYKKFKAEVYVLTEKEGGRHTPFFTHYRCVMMISMMMAMMLMKMVIVMMVVHR